MVKQAEIQLNFNPLDSRQIFNQPLVKLKPHSVSEYQSMKNDPVNPNSAVMVVFQSPTVKTVESEAIHNVLLKLLSQPFFDRLRTQE